MSDLVRALRGCHSRCRLLAACEDASKQQLIIIFGILLASLLLMLIMALWGAKVRTDMRKKFNIPGEGMNTCSCLRDSKPPP